MCISGNVLPCLTLSSAPLCIRSLYSGFEAMTMSVVTREKGLLKLVYPGRFVELHKNPVTVAEVLKKNPRHCVTRPDVFRFPWIVVRPDSVLNPGRVFFVVPYHTIHRLLQSKGSQDQSYSLPKGDPPDHNQDHLPHLRQTSVLDSWPELTPEHIGCESFFSRKSHVVSLNKHNSKCQPHVVAYPSDDQSPEQKYPIECSVKLTSVHRLLRKRSQNLSQNKGKFKPEDCRAECPRQKYRVEAGSKVMNSDMQYHDGLLEKSPMKLHAKMKAQHDGDQPPKKRYPVEKWPTAIDNYKHHQPHSKPQTPVNPLVEARPFCHIRQYAFDTKDLGLQPRTDRGSDLEHSKQVTQLKSCLKKHEDNASKSRDLRVTFAFPLEDNRKKLKTKPYKFH